MNLPSTSGRAVVLIVEDEPLVRMMVIELFEDEGFEVLEAANADQALGIFGERDDVALLFTDVEMPGSIDGYALARWVSLNRPSVKTMIVSGRALPRAGDVPDGAAFVGKPYDHDDIMRRVQTMMAG
ncbi:response regulator [Lichenibacterium minor]|jgi:CheY-like chemotaxis protein|uniref:Response regulator n=1 Tax=Lichenibacterium minor TaxID=2316528 RepID=A0A4Q2U7J0_9HYPH|nr:response regulator [Lichenibacterium minor]RYC32410.1 response regulator [Lichenibacterium minor]